MPTDTKSFLAVAPKDSKYSYGFTITKTLEEANAFLEARRTKTAKIATSANQEILDAIDNPSADDLAEKQVVEILLKYVNSVFSFYPLIAVGTTMKRPLLDGYVKDKLIETAKSVASEETCESGNYIFELDAAAMAVMDKQLSGFWALERGLSALPNAAFLSIVASFDSNFAEIVEHFLNVHPERYNSGSQLISLQDIIACGSVPAVVAKVVKDEIFELMRGSHDEQTEFVRDKMDVDIKGSWVRYGDFLEIFERRNLIAHGEKLFTLRYQDRLKLYKSVTNIEKVGEVVTISPKYLRHAADILLEYGVLLVFSLWRKHLKSIETESFTWLNIVATKAISEGRNLAVSRILTYVLTIKSHAFSDQSRKMATVNLANSLYKLNQGDQAEKVLAQTDWSAVSLDYTVCIAALRGQIQKVCELMDSAVKSGSLGPESFREWPVFDGIRDDSDFLEEYQRVFGEPLVPVKPRILDDALIANAAEADENSSSINEES